MGVDPILSPEIGSFRNQTYLISFFTSRTPLKNVCRKMGNFAICLDSVLIKPYQWLLTKKSRISNDVLSPFLSESNMAARCETDQMKVVSRMDTQNGFSERSLKTN